jgi:tetratricopeptide (TPR) repeat protein
MACYLKALEINPQYGKARFNCAKLLAKAGKTDEAIVNLRKALAIDPRSAHALSGAECVEALTALGDVLQHTGRIADAAASFRRALEISPGDIDARYNLGNALLQEGRIADAAACYRQVTDAAPGHVDARYNLGNTLLQTGHIDEAIACYLKVVEINPGYTDALNNLALALLHKGQRNEAIKYLERALAAARAAGQAERVKIIEGDLEKLCRERRHE